MVSLGITRDYFHVPKHRTFAEAVFCLLAEGKPIETLMVGQWLQDRNKLEEVGGPGFVMSVFQAMPTAMQASHYAQIITDKHRLRMIAIRCTDYAQRAIAEQSEVDGLSGEVISFSAELSCIGQRGSEPTIAETVMKVINDRHKAQEKPREVAGLATFFPSLDRDTGGLLRNNLRFICAPPNTGKTVLMLNDVECVSVINGLPSLVISFEMTREQLVTRLSASIAGVSIDDVRNNRLTMDEEAKWAEAMTKIAGAPITIKNEKYTIYELGNICRAWKANNPTGRLISIDGFQGIKFRLRDNVSVADQLKRHAVELKDITKELDVTMDVASHMDEKAERTKGSRGPEEDGDMVLILTTSTLTVKKSRSGGKGLEIPIHIHEQHQQVYERKVDEEAQPKKKGRKKPTGELDI
jgi:replicative DNA helicase